jgi:hypothetical protein
MKMKRRDSVHIVKWMKPDEEDRVFALDILVRLVDGFSVSCVGKRPSCLRLAQTL